jgi:hypothetical protein
MAQEAQKPQKDSSDQPVLGHIEKLVAEEHRLYNQKGLSEDDNARLAKIQVELDQAWDLLRQRRARREFGENPEGAQVRPAGIVEKYEG